MWEMQVRMLSEDTWNTIHPISMIVGELMSPYEYERKEDAESALKKLYPNTPDDQLRVVRV